MASRTRLAIWGETVGSPLTTRETDLMLTRARVATSCMVAARRATGGRDNVSLPQGGQAGVFQRVGQPTYFECTGQRFCRVLTFWSYVVSLGLLGRGKPMGERLVGRSEEHTSEL